MRHFPYSSSILLVLGFLAPFSAGSQPRDPFRIACLPTEQRAEVAALARKLVADLRIQEQLDEYKLLVQSDDGGGEAFECKQRLENVFETLQATLAGCPQKIEQYNRKVAEMNAKKESIATRQDLVRTQIQIYRSKYPSC